MSFLKSREATQNFSTSSLFLFASCVVFAFTRLYNLTILPIFNDEAFYLHWARIIHDDPSALWLPLVDGKTPLFYWVAATLTTHFDDPLIGGRLISVLSGFITLLLIYRTGKMLGSSMGGALSSWLYALLPFAFLNDRLATVDSFHTMFVVMSLHAALLLSFEGKKHHAAYLGSALSAAFLAKTPTMLFLPLPFITVFCLRPKKENTKRLTCKLACSYLLLTLVIAIYLTRDVQMIGEDGSKIFHRGRFFLPLSQLTAFPIKAWFNNLRDLNSYVKFYYSFPLLAWFILVLLYALIMKNQETLILALWSLIPVILLVLITKETFSRYYLAPLTPSLIAIEYGTSHLLTQGKTRKWKLISSAIVATFMALFLIQSAIFTAKFTKNPAATPMVKRDRWQYVEGYPSGYGLNKIMDYLKEQAGKKRIVVFTTMNWGNPADALKIYLHEHKNLTVVECYWWHMLPILVPEKEILPVINDKFRRQIVTNISINDFDEFYFVTGSEPFSKESFAGLNPSAKLLVKAPKPGGTSWFFLYRLK